MKKTKKFVLTALICLTAVFGTLGFGSCEFLFGLGVGTGIGGALTNNSSSCNHVYEPEIVAPICTELGCTIYTCSCGDSYKDDYVSSLGHTEVIDKAVAPTCTETGLTEGKHCEVCSTVLVAQEVVEANGHTEVVDKAVAPTCTETGLTEGKHCEVCSTVFVAQEVVEANGHNYVDGVCAECDDLHTKGLEYALSEDGKSYSVTGIGTCADTEIVIPASYQKLPVISIGDKAFYDCASLINITIPDSIISIGNGAFNNCRGLTSVVIPDSVTSIGSSAFYNCHSLTSVEIGDSVTSIGAAAFFCCASLTSVVIPEGVISIGVNTFVECTSLTSIVIPESVTLIDRDAFLYCTNLTGVYITDIAAWCNVSFKMSLQSNPLYYAHNLYLKGELVTELIIPDNVTSIGVGVFLYCTSLKSVTIPASVTSIGASAFRYCEGLTSVTIPDSVETIDNAAFEDCTGLTSVVIGDSVTSIGNYAFSGCTSLTSVYYHGTAEDWADISIGSYDNDDFINMNRYYYSENEPSLNTDFTGYEGNYWYYDENGEINVWDEEEFNKTMFSLSYELNMDGKSYSVTDIGNCTNTEIVIPSTYKGLPVISIGGLAFFNCRNLTSVVIPDSVRYITNNAFLYCDSLTSITVDENNEYYKSIEGNLYTKDGKTLIQYAIGKTDEYFTIPDGVTTIGERAFDSCGSLLSVEIPNSVVTIGDYAFESCTNLDYIEIPNSVTSIGALAFCGCDRLTYIYIGSGVNYIGGDIFEICNSLRFIEVSPYNKSFKVVNGSLYTIDGKLIYEVESF